MKEPREAPSDANSTTYLYSVAKNLLSFNVKIQCNIEFIVPCFLGMQN